MNEAEWLSAPNVFSLLFYLRDQNGNDPRRLRLFGCACCRRVWHLLQLDAARRIVELTEAYADGEVGITHLQAAYASVDFADLGDLYEGTDACGGQLSRLTFAAMAAARWLASTTFNTVSADSVAEFTLGNQASDFFRSPEWDLPSCGVPPDDLERAQQAKLLRDIFGNPFRPVTFDPVWRTENTVGIAAKMYYERDFLGMPILADALQDAGCEDEVILSHCRGAGPHVRGCWVVDLVLGKQ